MHPHGMLKRKFSKNISPFIIRKYGRNRDRALSGILWCGSIKSNDTYILSHIFSLVVQSQVIDLFKC
jgi:hypothetical protein